MPEECTRRTTTPPDKTSAGLALKSREEEGTNMHTASKKEQIIAAAAAILGEPEPGFHLERLGGCRAKRAKKDDASKKVSDAQGRHRRQRRQVDGRGFRLRLPQPPTTD